MTVPDLNFGDLTEAVARVSLDRPAIIHGDHVLTWRELDQRANRLARHLQACGLTPGSKVAFYLRNGPAYVELLAACFKGRFTHVNVNYRYVDQELFYILDNCDTEAVVYDAEFDVHVGSLRDSLPGVKTWIRVDGPDAPSASEFERACSEGDATALDIERSGDDLYFMCTGGTTGYPKAVMWPHKARIAVVEMTPAQNAADHGALIAANDQRPVVMPAAPLMHSTGFTSTVACMLSGGCLVLLPTTRFDADVCLDQIEEHQVERLAIVGDAFSVPLIEALERRDELPDLSHVQAISSAGAMWSEPLKRRLLEYFTNAALSDSLGSSEGSRLGASVMKRGDPGRTASFSIGPEVKVFSEDFREIKPGSGEAGMIAKAGPLPLGYYNDEESTRLTFPTINGVRYSLAGDWCRVEEDGTLTLLGRGNNCINTGGEKVYPEEVEEALKTCPGIEDAAVLGVPDERWGESVAALLTLKAGETINRDLIKSHLSRHLASYKHPRTYRQAGESFRHDNGKVNYRLARRLLASASELMR